MYDDFGQLVLEEVGGNTYVYTYDTYGNIRTAEKYEYTGFSSPNQAASYGTLLSSETYTYGDSSWLDLLTAYNGQSITYDAIGNPLSYYNGQSYTFTWENGRQLARAVVGGQTLTYKYNVDGIRTEKTLLGEYTDTYRLNGTQVVEMSHDGSDGTYRLVFVYDENGSPLCFDLYSGSNTTSVRYYYVTNLQGDVVRLINSNNATVADYTYDAWGKLLGVTDANGNAITSEYHIANINPLRYRGYFYDIETGLYYCNSRYYDPQIKRFINADELLSTGTGFLGYNMFAYCNNNPVMYCDPSGAWLGYAIKKVYNMAKDFVESHIDLSAVGAWFLQMEKDEDGIYHASFDCWQQYFGYNDLYDRVFDTATSMESEKFPFEYDGETYTFWAWKGDYLNLGAGAEMGIYVGDSYHKSVDKSLAMPMQMELSYKGETIINYGPAERHWWITGFNPAVPEVNADDLFAVYWVDFNNTGMYYAFKNSFNGNYGNWLLFDSSTQAIFFFD